MSIVIGCPHFAAVAPEWVVAYEELQKPPETISVHIGRSVVSTARNMIVQAALKHWRALDAAEPSRDTAADYCFMYDDDLLIEPGALMRLLSHRLSIVGGLYTTRHAPYKPIAGRQFSPPGVLPRQMINLRAFTPGLQQVDLLGAGCLLVARRVFEAITSPWFDFQAGPTQAEDWPEDAYFCEKARMAGFELALDFDVQAAHVTTRVVTWQDAMEYDRTVGLPAPATPELAAAAYTIRPWPPGSAPPMDARQARPSPAPAPARPGRQAMSAAPPHTHKRRGTTKSAARRR